MIEEAQIFWIIQEELFPLEGTPAWKDRVARRVAELVQESESDLLEAVNTFLGMYATTSKGNHPELQPAFQILIDAARKASVCTKCGGLGWIPSLKYSSVCRNFRNDGTELGWALCGCNGPMTVDIRPDQKPMPTHQPTRTGPWFPNG